MKTSWLVIASGPSLTQSDVDAAKRLNAIAINDNYRLCHWASVLYACDPHWWEWHRNDPKLETFAGEKWTQTESWTEDQKRYIGERHRLNWIKSLCEPGLSVDKSVIHQGSNSGIQAINLAYHFGAKTIVLLGFDMQATGGKDHWFGSHPNNASPIYDQLIPRFDFIARQCQDIGLQIINATRSSALKCFERMDINDAVDYCLHRDRPFFDVESNSMCA